jgi:murein DD-endopeptidase MepM/ murein hydrolase activator NlpD
MPVEGATKSDYNKDTFWFYPWGKSVTHKGVDIFAKEGTNVKSSTWGIVLYSGKIEVGGNVVLILGPKWRLHYYAHLKD